jgi:hypothetical protein
MGVQRFQGGSFELAADMPACHFRFPQILFISKVYGVQFRASVRVSSARYAKDLRSVRAPTLEMSGDASRTNSVFQL